MAITLKSNDTTIAELQLEKTGQLSSKYQNNNYFLTGFNPLIQEKEATSKLLFPPFFSFEIDETKNKYLQEGCLIEDQALSQATINDALSAITYAKTHKLNINRPIVFQANKTYNFDKDKACEVITFSTPFINLQGNGCVITEGNFYFSNNVKKCTINGFIFENINFTFERLSNNKDSYLFITNNIFKNCTIYLNSNQDKIFIMNNEFINSIVTYDDQNVQENNNADRIFAITRNIFKNIEDNEFIITLHKNFKNIILSDILYYDEKNTSKKKINISKLNSSDFQYCTNLINCELSTSQNIPIFNQLDITNNTKLPFIDYPIEVNSNINIAIDTSSLSAASNHYINDNEIIFPSSSYTRMGEGYFNNLANYKLTALHRYEFQSLEYSDIIEDKNEGLICNKSIFGASIGINSDDYAEANSIKIFNCQIINCDICVQSKKPLILDHVYLQASKLGQAIKILSDVQCIITNSIIVQDNTTLEPISTFEDFEKFTLINTVIYSQNLGTFQQNAPHGYGLQLINLKPDTIEYQNRPIYTADNAGGIFYNSYFKNVYSFPESAELINSTIKLKEKNYNGERAAFNIDFPQGSYLTIAKNNTVYFDNTHPANVVLLKQAPNYIDSGIHCLISNCVFTNNKLAEKGYNSSIVYISNNFITDKKAAAPKNNITINFENCIFNNFAYMVKLSEIANLYNTKINVNFKNCLFNNLKYPYQQTHENIIVDFHNSCLYGPELRNASNDNTTSSNINDLSNFLNDLAEDERKRLKEIEAAMLKAITLAEKEANEMTEAELKELKKTVSNLDTLYHTYLKGYDTWEAIKNDGKSWAIGYLYYLHINGYLIGGGGKSGLANLSYATIRALVPLARKIAEDNAKQATKIDNKYPYSAELLITSAQVLCYSLSKYATYYFKNSNGTFTAINKDNIEFFGNNINSLIWLARRIGVSSNNNDAIESKIYYSDKASPITALPDLHIPNSQIAPRLSTIN